MNKPVINTVKTAKGKTTNAPNSIPYCSILRKPNQWGSCKQRHSANKVEFVEFAVVRVYQPDLPEGKKMISTGYYNRCAKKKREFNKSTRYWIICEMLKNWIEHHRRKVEMHSHQSKPKETENLKLRKRPASPCPSRPTKRRKLNPSAIMKKVLSIPRSVKEWVCRTNKFVGGAR